MDLRSLVSITSLPPILLVLAQVLTTSVTLGFTKASFLPLPSTAPLVFLNVASLISRLRLENDIRTQWASLLSGTSILLLFQHTEVAFLTPRQCNAHAIKTVPSFRALQEAPAARDTKTTQVAQDAKTHPRPYQSLHTGYERRPHSDILTVPSKPRMFHSSPTKSLPTFPHGRLSCGKSFYERPFTKSSSTPLTLLRPSPKKSLKPFR